MNSYMVDNGIKEGMVVRYEEYSSLYIVVGTSPRSDIVSIVPISVRACGQMIPRKGADPWEVSSFSLSVEFESTAQTDTVRKTYDYHR